MYYEEKVIDGVLCYRSNPQSQFTQFTLEELKKREHSAVKKTFTYFADMGIARVKFTDGSATFLDNGIEDGEYDIHILEEGDRSPDDQIAGFFYVKTSASLMGYDCESGAEKALYEFGPGRYYAEHDDDGNIYITRFND